jgi:hypothetical protein
MTSVGSTHGGNSGSSLGVGGCGWDDEVCNCSAFGG